ncbi:MAG: SprB repeat-containing protein, partial [Crocinitomicaceae bacterium]
MRRGFSRILTFPIILVFCLSNFHTQAQSIIINEVSQGSSGSQEYVEFVVTGPALVNCNDTPPCIDLRLWIFDDNNGYLNGSSTTGVGIASGACRFADDPFWSCIPVGTVIVIYNDADPNGGLPADDVSMGDNNCTLVVPISSGLFDTHGTQPNSTDNTYPTTGWTNGGNWINISMANTQDGFLIFDPSNTTTPVFSIGWGSDNTLGDIYMGSSSASGDVFYGTDCNFFTQSSWIEGSASSDQTAGVPNNATQADCIGNMNANCNPPTMTLAAVAETCLGACDGTASATITGGTTPYVLDWSPAPGSGQGTTNVSGLCAGTYTLTLIDDNGTGCTLVDSVVVAAGPPCCLITNMSANIGACDATTGTYSTTGTVEFTDPPTTGQL